MEAEEKMNVETWMESVGATAETKAAYYATLESQVNRFNVMISGGTVPHDDDAMEVEEPEEVLGIVDSFLEELKADFDKTTKTPIAVVRFLSLKFDDTALKPSYNGFFVLFLVVFFFFASACATGHESDNGRFSCCN
jgi:hypothetical protein